jgi:hypothetical protein
MSDFYRYTDVKKAKRRHQCNHCHVMIEIGEAYHRGSGNHDGDFFVTVQHHECLKAASELYKLHELDSYEYFWLWEHDDLKWDAPWLWEHHPIVAARLAQNYPDDMPKEHTP